MSLSQSQEEAISDGRLTPAHLQVLSGPHNMAAKLLTSTTPPHGTIGASSLPLVNEREDSATPKQSHYSLNVKVKGNVIQPQKDIKTLNVPFQLPKDNPVGDFYLPMRGNNGNRKWKSFSDTHAVGNTQGKQKSSAKHRKGKRHLFKDPGPLAARGNRANWSLRGYSDSLSNLCQPFLPPADSSLPSDTSCTDTVQLDVSEDSSTKETAQDCTTEEDTPQETLTPDVSRAWA